MSKYTSDASSSSPSTRGSSLTTTPGSPSHDECLELKNMAATENAAQVAPPPPPPSIHTDVMQLARLGEIGAIQKLHESGQVDPKYKDDEGITPLHWAAINNRYELCRYLLEAGADANAKGGESVATPAMWAAQRCHYYIVHLLLKYGADPLLTDAQGYNLLHLASIDGNAFLLALLLHQEIPVDVVDPQGHTALMWAAYKGFPICVDLFLRWGADVNAADDAGLSPIHWALVRGSGPCIQKIVEYGADRFAKTKDGKTPAVVAEEMKTTHLWRRALRECGYGYDGNIPSLPVGLDVLLRKRVYISRFFLLLPFFAIPSIIFILSNLSIFLSIPVTLIFLYVMQRIVKFVAGRGPAEFRVLQRTPLLAGVFAGSLFWVGVQWALYILPATYSSYLFSNIFFLLFYTATTYFYTLSMIENPGYVPKSTSRDQQKAVITELFESWTFDEDHFCVYCMTRKPLRSKHCRQCKRCVSKHDHHCPWVNNCVGTNNFRHFVMYILTLEVGVLIYISLVISYFSSIPAPENVECSIISSSICSVVNRDPFTFLLSVWTSFQLIWVTMLCVVQLIQISRNQTTYENMKGSTFDSRPRVPPGHVELGGAAQPTENAGEPRQRPHKHGLSGCLATWKQLLGLHTFMATAQDGLGNRGGAGGGAGSGARQRNPFSHGVIGNCRDFWCDPAPYLGRRDPGSGMLGGQAVNYYNLYDMDFAMMRSGGSGGSSSRTESGMVYGRVATEDVGAMA